MINAVDAVILAMKQTAGRGKRLFLHSVPEAAARLLAANSAGRVSVPDAWPLVSDAIEKLHQEGKIERHLDSQRDWRILCASGSDLQEAARTAILDTRRDLTVRGKPAHELTVREEAAKLLYKRAAGKIALTEADELVVGAIDSSESGEP